MDTPRGDNLVDPVDASSLFVLNGILYSAAQAAEGNRLATDSVEALLAEVARRREELVAAGFESQISEEEAMISVLGEVGQLIELNPSEAKTTGLVSLGLAVEHLSQDPNAEFLASMWDDLLGEQTDDLITL